MHLGRTAGVRTGAGNRTGARNATDGVVLGLVIGLTLADGATARRALRGVALQAHAVTVLGVDGVFTTQRVITLVAAEALRMVSTAFGGELTALNRLAAGVAIRRRAGDALDFAVAELVLHVLDGLVASLAGEALVVEGLTIGRDIGAVHGQVAAALSAADGAGDTMLLGHLADVSVGLADRNLGGRDEDRVRLGLVVDFLDRPGLDVHLLGGDGRRGHLEQNFNFETIFNGKLRLLIKLNNLTP